MLAFERKPETGIELFFEYELTPYPNSLFDKGVMRPVKRKSLQ